jgi:hypothetical protein
MNRPRLKTPHTIPLPIQQPLLRLFLCLLSALHLSQAFATIPHLGWHCSGRPYRAAAECPTDPRFANYLSLIHI